eukprot:TRINITY_DN14678_c0_g1_i1.p2 TRINITY_DN14678_c0_g1~~TRINITY_DN14678_c0_g1_i1.p2  ORF type:complete len:223 (+),score=76.75 TRINITY_DN14678_c0_g1_i1:83-670(+)
MRRACAAARSGCAAAARRGACYALGDLHPKVGKGAWVAPNAAVIGDVRLGEGASVWFGATLRGDCDTITVGDRSNIQDNSVCHADHGVPLTIGSDVVVGHLAMLHGCDIGDGSLIGIGAVVLNRTKIGKNCLIGANAFIPEGKTIEDGSMVIGSPGKVVRKLTEEQIRQMHEGAAHYVRNAERFAADLKEVEPAE